MPLPIVHSLILYRISVIPGKHTKVCILGLEFLPYEFFGYKSHIIEKLATFWANPALPSLVCASKRKKQSDLD